MKKRILLTAVALILVCALSIMGTVAYLQSQTDTVTNTFVAAGGGKLIEDGGTFTLQEHKANKVTKIVVDDEGEKEIWTGKYELDDTELAPTKTVEGVTIMGNEYEIMPGMIIPKDPVVTITGKTESPAYLYIEVINNLDFSTEVDDEETLVIDPENWRELPTVTGPNGGKVYVYTTDKTNAAIVTEDVSANIIQNNQFRVNKEVDLTNPELTDQELTFNAFLAQASIGDETDAAEIFKDCFITAATPDPAP